MNNVSATVKMLRKKYGLTQEELCLKSGLGLRFIRDVEQGKASLRLDKVNQLLDLFNYEMAPTPKAKP
ncbi:MAG: helix-turn-helix transcriptional regulator [Prevotellaceae bacterium]|nr:helix-turn-helix transcriptional regulator [Prevotellaceae bacterium]MCD8285263.1 helix-turn-helix transcriptional regulator [Prevotellaceae bacterium]MCD8304764.1 helix-turn-helix transcriptional regulator [Prevotellaceae bacterium]